MSALHPDRHHVQIHAVELNIRVQHRETGGDILLLRREGDAYREAAIEPYVDWPSYHGSYSGNRHSPLDQIDRDNIGGLAMRWFFPIPDMPMIEGTPVVIAGVMYVTAVNQVYALDAATGREIWRYAQPRTEGLVGDPGIGLNRGVAVHDDLVFSVTDHAHVIALDRFTGALVWDTEMDDYREHYGAVVAPLVVDDLVIAGISAGDTGLRVSWTLITPRRASGLGVSGQSRHQGSRAPRRGATRRCCAAAAAPPG